MAATGMTASQTKKTHHVTPQVRHSNPSVAAAHAPTVHAPTGYPSNSSNVYHPPVHHNPPHHEVVHPAKHTPVRGGPTVTAAAVKAAKKILQQHGHTSFAEQSHNSGIAELINTLGYRSLREDGGIAAANGPFSFLSGDQNPVQLLMAHYGLNEMPRPHTWSPPHGSTRNIQDAGQGFANDPLPTTPFDQSPAGHLIAYLRAQQNRLHP